MRKKRLYLVAVNNRYGDNVFLPYAAGLLWSYARQFQDITDHWELCGVLYVKEKISWAVERLHAPDLVAFSSYIWSHQWNRALAREVKSFWPTCTTLVGGIQIEDHDALILAQEPVFDFAIYGEGEGAFASFLRGHVHGDYERCGSLIWPAGDRFQVNERHAETPLDTIPSPYLDGFFEPLLPQEKHFQALQETNRGCSYS